MTRIQIRRDTSSNWATYNPVLADGEFALETDTRKLKIGNGEQPYNDLAYQEETYTLPVATADTLGGIKVGENLSITEDGVLNATSGDNTAFNSTSPILINQNCNPYINNDGLYILENSYNNNGINNITVNDYHSIGQLPTSGTITLNIQNVTGNKIDWDNNVLGFNITNPNNATIYTGNTSRYFSKFIVLCNKSGNNITPLYIAIGDNSRTGASHVGDANSCLLNNIEFQNIQDNKGIYNANIKQIINVTPYNIQNFFVRILVDANIIQLCCVGTDKEEHLLFNVSGLTDLADINYAYILSGSGTATFNEDTVYSIVDGQKKYPTIIRNATDVNISLKYSDKFVLNNEALDLANTITTQGNTFNGANQLVQLDSNGKLPAIDGSQLTNLPTGTAPTNMVTTDTNQTITGFKTHKIGGAPFAGNICVTDSGSLNTGNRLLIDHTSLKIANNSNDNGYYKASYGTENLFLNDNREHSSNDYFTISTNRRGGSYWNIGWNNTPATIVANSLKRQDNFGSTSYDILDTSNIENYIDSNTITWNGSKLSANTGNLKFWTGTQTEYNAITTKDADTLYRTTDTNTVYLGTIQLSN